MGGAPGTRETDLLKPGRLVEHVHAVVLSGGSAFGLASADGVARYLAEQGVGHPTNVGVVPIVPTAILFDLAVGRADVQPAVLKLAVLPRRSLHARLSAPSFPLPQHRARRRPWRREPAAAHSFLRGSNTVAPWTNVGREAGRSRLGRARPAVTT